MKKFILLFSLALLNIGYAQDKIKVTYSSQTKIDIDNVEVIGDGATNKENQKLLEAAFEEIHYYELITSAHESAYKKVEKINNDLTADGEMRISISFGGSNSYKNLDSGEMLEKVSNFNHDFIIVNSLQDFDWQISREKDKVLNYDVRKATATDSLQTVTAWYAPSLPIKSGPSDYWGLPGLILKLEVQRHDDENTSFYFLAQDVTLLPEETVIAKPTEGKRVSNEEFEAFTKAQLKKFREMNAQGVDTSD